MKVLVACEESGVVRNAFRERGFEAYSNDLMPARDGKWKQHLQMDCNQALLMHDWDLIIMHPPCDFLTNAGNRWYGRGAPRFQMRLSSVEWTLKFWQDACLACPHVAMENPKGVLPISATQYIQPYEFGHAETKETGLWLHGLPELRPTNVIPLPKCPEAMKAWEVCWRMPESKNRKQMRSETKLGIAKAMAEQWGDYIMQPTGGHAACQLMIL